jgi:histidine ammonia-lyase
MTTTVAVGPSGVSPTDVLAVARGGAPVEIAPDAVAVMTTSRSIVDNIERDGRPVYGVSTGFGALASTFVAPERRAELQHALIRSHAAGHGRSDAARGGSGHDAACGSARSPWVVRASGRWSPRRWSICSTTTSRRGYQSTARSAPRATWPRWRTCALVLLGEGWVLGKDGARVPGAEALPAPGLVPIELAAKEGSRSSTAPTACSACCCSRSKTPGTVHHGDMTGALAVEAMLGSDRPFLPELHTIRPHPGQAVSAANMHRLLQGSAIMDSHRDDMTHAVQDAYSMRCAPQVAGAARDTLDFATLVAGRELASIVDNPVVLTDGRVLSTANFHGAPSGFAADFLAIAAAEIGAISERRVDRLLDVCRSRDPAGVPQPGPGVNSGLMIAQYTAAGIVAENRRLASPASVDSVPTSGMQEDHVSMGWAATRKLRQVLDNVTSLLAVELLAAVRALQLRAPMTPSPAGRLATQALAPHAGEPGPDIFLAPVLEAARAMVGGRDLRSQIEAEDRPAGLTSLGRYRDRALPIQPVPESRRDPQRLGIQVVDQVHQIVL